MQADIPTGSSKSKRPVIFLGVGIFNTLVDFCFYTLLTSILLRADSQIALAGFISGTFGLLCAFLTHSLITWRDSHIDHRTIAKFIVLTGFGMWVIRPFLLAIFIHLGELYSVVHTLTETLRLPFSYDFVAKTGAFGFMIVIVLIYNFSVYERFVFNKPKVTIANIGDEVN